MAIATASLRESAVSALKWNYLGQGVRTVCGLVIGIVLARLLGPKPFGQVAIALLVIGLSNQIADLGLGAALVQSKTLSERDIRFGFSLQVLLGVVLTSLCMLLATPIARLFHQPDVAPVIMALALMFFLQALGQTAAGLLRRELAFRPLQIAQVLSYLIGYLGVGIPLAYRGGGVWSLVAAQLCQTVVNSAMVYASKRHPVLPSLQHDNRIVSFGVKVIGTNVVNWIITNLDTAIAGRFFTVFDLGLYNRAFNFAITPAASGMSALQGVMFSATSRLQDQTNRLARTYLACLSGLGVLTFPLYAAIAVVPDTVINALYGPKWTGAAPLLAAFAVAAPLHVAMGMAGPALWGLGKVEREFRAQAIVACAAILVFALSAQMSLMALAIGVTLIYGLRFLLMTWSALNLLQISWAKVAAGLRGALGLAVLVAACVRWADMLLSGYGAGPVVRLGLDVSVGAIIQVGALLLMPSVVIGAEASAILCSYRSSIPFLRLFLPRAVATAPPL